jgi:hypothetical protein
VRPLENAAWAAAAIDLATSNSAATRACYAGSLLQCESALGLTAVKDSLTEWYAPEDWRVLVASSQQGLNLDLPTRHAWKACVDGHDLPACERLARTRRTPVPLSHATRQSLYEFAMTRGGDGAYARLLAAKGTAFEVVTAASGTSGDSLIARWRVHLLASMPPSARPGVLEFTIALAWTALFATAAMRKGR